MRALSLIGIGIGFAVAAGGGCTDKGGEIKIRQAQVVPTMKPLENSEPFIMDRRMREDEIAELAKGTKSSASAAAQKDAQKGDKQDQEWVPKENVKGASRWKDTGIYVDGQPIGFLAWGELPLNLKPYWMKDKVSANKRPGTSDLGWRWARQRFYRFKDYLAAVGIDPRTIKEMHVYGPKLSDSTVVTGAELASKEGDGFMFRFGANVGGKAIPLVPDDFGNNKKPDKIAGVMIYIKKPPPKWERNVGFTLDGTVQYGVPYSGEPIRGGIRVYLDDKLATIIKRQDLTPTNAKKNASGELEWSLPEFLAKAGVDTSKVVEVWGIRDERREHKWPASKLPTMTFVAASQAKTKGGGIVIMPDDLRVNHIALHSKPVTPAMMPVITPDDD